MYHEVLDKGREDMRHAALAELRSEKPGKFMYEGRMRCMHAHQQVHHHPSIAGYPFRGLLETSLYKSIFTDTYG